ncbi:MAG: SNF2-related protein [Nannocystaceae bacterium]|nr:DEAD/DEAH box helicase family protein [bacterium]
MTEARTRKWLRTFLHLNAREDADGIPRRDIERQEQTILRALQTLDARPGIILADEVGMGKTYEALGLAAAIRHHKPNARIVVITPGPDLNTKWVHEFERFKQMYDFGGEVRSAKKLSTFVQSTKEAPIVVAPVTMFQGGKGGYSQAYLLSLYCHWAGLHGHTANALFRRFKDGGYARVDVEEALFLGLFSLDQVERHLGAAFTRGRKREGWAGLHDLYERGGLEGFDQPHAVRNALYRARFVLAGRLLPTIDLLIVDEAHKLKNSRSLRSQGMRTVFTRRFRKAAFLTATPFQLDIGELREVFGLFGLAKGAPKTLSEDVDALLSAIREYQQAYDTFQATWCALDPAVAAEFARGYDADPEGYAPKDESLAIVRSEIAALKKLKSEVIEPGFRQWMIRSLREDKREYRKHDPKRLKAEGDAVLPFLIYERLIAELFRRHRPTHKAAVEINMVSSYAAAKAGALMSSGGSGGGEMPSEVEGYRELLREVLEEIDGSSQRHPKLDAGVADALEAAAKGEKTLIFCARVATLEQLRRKIRKAWDERMLQQWRVVYPSATAEEIFGHADDDDKRIRGRHANLQQRFHRSQDALYLALREPYLRTAVPIAEWALENLEEVVAEANRLRGGVRVSAAAAKRVNYQVAKRCVEQASLTLWKRTGRRVECNAEVMAALAHPDYLTLGLDLAKDAFENDAVGDETPQWEISEEVAGLVLEDRGSAWDEVADLLGRLPTDMRVRVVEQLARYLTYRELEFLPQLLRAAKVSGLQVETVESKALLGVLGTFWHGAGVSWSMLLQRFLEYFVSRDQIQQESILDGPIKRGDFVRHTKDGESREKLREAFNTPLFPMILVANEVMQEGLDLHRQCRRIVHHDLAWNPAQIEQRIGRVDRLGSRILQLRRTGSSAKLEVLYPLIRGTIDERMYRVVKMREKWLEFLLGAEPQFGEYAMEETEPPELPGRLAGELAIDLGPRGRL